MTGQDIINEVAARLNYPSGALPTQVQARFLAFLNHAHRKVLTQVNKLRISRFPLQMVNGQQQFTLPPGIEEVIDIIDPQRNMRKLNSRTMQWVRQHGPQAEIFSLGPPSDWVNMGVVAYQQQIVQIIPTANLQNIVFTSSSNLTAVSSNTADTANVCIEYFTAGPVATDPGGYPGSANVALTGTTPIQVGTANNITELTSFYLSSECNGFVTLAVANGTIISTLAPGQTFARFKSILLFPTPNDSSLVLLMDCVRQVPDMLANPNQEPLIPLDWQWILIEGVLYQEYEKMNDARYTLAKTEFEDQILVLADRVLSNDDLIGVARGRQSIWYPFRIPLSGPSTAQ